MSQHDTLTQAWHYETFPNLGHSVLTSPAGERYELRSSDLAHPRALAAFSAMLAALSATQPDQAAQSEPNKIMQNIDTLIACMNEAHHANSEGWRDACFQSADRVREQIKDSVTALTSQQAAQGAGEVVAIHPSWLDYWSFKECDRLARIWTEGIDLTKSDDHEDDLGPQWKVVMAIMLARLTHPTPAQPAPVVPDIKAMAYRLMMWKLPQDFSPDGGIIFKKPENPANWPIGTNLLTVQQAEEMLAHVLSATPTPPAQAAADARDAERWRYALASENFAVCKWESVFGDPSHDWVPISEPSEIDAALATHQQGGSNA